MGGIQLKDTSGALVASDDASFREGAASVLEGVGYAVTALPIAAAAAEVEASTHEMVVVHGEETTEAMRVLAHLLHRRNRPTLFVGSPPSVAGRLFVHVPAASSPGDVAAGALRVSRHVQRSRDASAAGLLTELVHSLRNSLMVSVGNLVFLKSSSLEGEYREALEDSHEAALTMQRLLWDVSHLQRLAAGTAALNREAFDVRELLDEVAKNLPAREQKTTRVLIEVGDDAKLALGDRATLLRALGAMALYSARQVVDSGTVSLSAERSGAGVLFRTGAPRSEGADRMSWASRGDDSLSGMNGVEIAYCRAASEVHGGSFWTSGDPSSPAFFLEIGV